MTQPIPPAGPESLEPAPGRRSRGEHLTGPADLDTAAVLEGGRTADEGEPIGRTENLCDPAWIGERGLTEG